MSQDKTSEHNTSGRKLGMLVPGAILAALLGVFQPWNVAGLASQPHAVGNYAEAVQRIEALQAGEGNLNPVCHTQFMTHGQKTARVIVFAHGYTNCPQQFNELGKRFYALGYNVLIAPVP